MSSNTITPVPVLNRISSDDEILGLVTHLPRRNGRSEANGDGRESTGQAPGPRTSDQLEMDFDTEQAAKGTRRSSAAETKTPSVDVTTEIEPEHLRAALDANPELRDAWREAGAYRETLRRRKKRGPRQRSLGI